ncbi:hypothetical protein NUU61_007861 [Penicillium alfredii]|uniref:Uncharacterized protein n=1 Tax=Penicillium alfredii TaxID=1506179 RepID=A0A9W9ERG8_9EURO|nr:uncharacterized protein NUU61_007861 [Penicillium alfredii]KAJ5086554.1 hypothetical protein NUU61_007861 [Penicillium alfredii]
MLLNLGLTADAAAAHTNEAPSNSSQTESQPSPTSTPYSTFSLSALPVLGTFYNRSKHPDGPTHPTRSASDMAMSPIVSESSGENTSKVMALPTKLRAHPRAISYSTRKSSRPKTSYQFAHPAAHARHKRLRLRPKLLLQLQQVSQTPRPLPILDILPSTLYLPRLARKFPAMFRGKNGLGPNDLIIVMSELYERTVSKIPENGGSSEDEDEEHREVVATICQLLQEDARLKGKAEICLNFGPVWEATPLASGSYEFVAHTDHGVQVMRWALRGGKNRRVSATPGTQPSEDPKRFTFSIIDPHTRRHPVIASMTRNQLEVYDQYSTAPRSSGGPTTPNSGMSVASDVSDLDAPVNPNAVTLDDGLRTLIIITGIWVAFREGWSHNFSYGDPVSTCQTKSAASPATSKHSSPTTAKTEKDALAEHDTTSPVKEPANGGKRCMSISSIRRANTLAPSEQAKPTPIGSLSKRSNSTGAAFMDRVKRRSASGTGSRLNRHSMLTGSGEHGRDIVVSRPTSLRQNSIDPEESPNNTDKTKSKPQAKLDTKNVKQSPEPDRAVAGPHAENRHVRHAQPPRRGDAEPSSSEGPNSGAAKGKRRHRLSSLLAIFSRKNDAH